MTLTELNQQKYELRQKMYKAQNTVDFCQERIAYLNREYQAQFETPLFDEMFGGWYDLPTRYW